MSSGYINKNNRLINYLLTTNHAVGRSNRSGRAIQNKGFADFSQAFLLPVYAVVPQRETNAGIVFSSNNVQLIVNGYL